MQWLKLVSEDTGIERLKADNRRPAVTRGVEATPPYPSTHAVKIGDGTSKRQANDPERRHKGDRRSGDDRRCKQEPVVLDTRSRHDRRGIVNRRKTESPNKQLPTPRRRINLYA